MKNGFRILLLGLLSLTTGTLIADTFDAVVDWNRRVEIGFGMSGQVKAVEVGPGDAVAAGAVLVSLDTVLLEIAVRKASNTEAISEAEMERQLAVLEREQTLYDEGALPPYSWRKWNWIFPGPNSPLTMRSLSIGGRATCSSSLRLPRLLMRGSWIPALCPGSSCITKQIRQC